MVYEKLGKFIIIKDINIKKTIESLNIKYKYILLQTSNVKTKFRIPSYDIIKTTENYEEVHKIKKTFVLKEYETIVVENKIRMIVNPIKCFYNRRYSEERKRISKKIIGKKVCILYSGTGCFSMYLDLKINITNVDWNEDAIKLSNLNAIINKKLNITNVLEDVHIFIVKPILYDTYILINPSNTLEILRYILKNKTFKKLIFYITLEKNKIDDFILEYSKIILFSYTRVKDFSSGKCIYRIEN